VIYAAVLWTAQQIVVRYRNNAAPRLRRTALVLAGLVLLQIYLGALVAGTNAGLAYNTWPLIDGAFIPAPERLWFLAPAWRNVFENILTVQFDHRMLAYAIWLIAMAHAVDAWRLGGRARGALILAGAVTVQATLGIITLLYQAALPLALTHQSVAIVVFTLAVIHAEHLWDREAGAAAIVPVEVGA
jgi:cytochrome c oxidase assembly protein subunit 15